MNVRSLFLMAALATASCLSAETAEQWIAKARSFLGDEAALNGVKSIHFSGSLETPANSNLPTDIVFQHPYRQRITVVGPKVVETTALDGYDGWQKRVNAENQAQWQVTLLDASQVKRLRANTLENLCFYSSRSLKGCVIRLVGDVTVDGLHCVQLSFTHTGGVVFTRYFEKSSGRLIKTVTENGTEIHEEGEMRVSGVRFPRRVVNKAPDGSVTAITFEKVVVNEAFPAEDFAVPSLQAR